MSTVLSKIRCDDDDEDVMGKLPDDIVIKTIIKLPAETLVQLVPYSKQFRRVITDPHFAQAHFHLSKIHLAPTHWLSMTGGTGRRKCQFHLSYSKLIGHPNYTWNTIETPFQFPKCSYELRIVGSARGVVCLAYIDYFDHLFLWNPTVNRFITVPITLPNSKRRLHYGFGFDCDFKTVQLAYDYQVDEGTNFQNAEAMVYEAKSRRWRTIDSKVPCYVMPRRPSVFVNGNVYWLANPRSVTDIYNEKCCIMEFNLVKEVFNVVDVPQDRFPNESFSEKLYRLSTSSDGKSLALFATVPAYAFGLSVPGWKKDWSVWYLMNGVNDSPRRWEIRYRLVVYQHNFRPLCILNDDHGVVLAELEDGRKCVLNGVKKGSNCSDFTLLGSNTTVRSSPSSYTGYTPSLALLEIEDAQQVVFAEKRKGVGSFPGLIQLPSEEGLKIFNERNHY